MRARKRRERGALEAHGVLGRGAGAIVFQPVQQRGRLPEHQREQSQQREQRVASGVQAAVLDMGRILAQAVAGSTTGPRLLRDGSRINLLRRGISSTSTTPKPAAPRPSRRNSSA